MAKGIHANRILDIVFTLIFIPLLVFFLSEMQKPKNNDVNYITSYLIFEKITLNDLILLKALIISLTIIFPISIGVSFVLRGRVKETPNWFFIALFILLVVGIYLTFLI
jgi:hypothetical protein